MKIQQIRNATIIIEYAGKRFLVDPVLGEKGSFAPFPFSHHQELRNPLHDLPMKAEEIVNNIDCVLLTHLHPDHIDNTAYELLNKKVHIFVQDEQDRKTVMSHGFTNVERRHPPNKDRKPSRLLVDAPLSRSHLRLCAAS